MSRRQQDKLATDNNSGSALLKEETLNMTSGEGAPFRCAVSVGSVAKGNKRRKCECDGVKLVLNQGSSK